MQTLQVSECYMFQCHRLECDKGFLLTQEWLTALVTVPFLDFTTGYLGQQCHCHCQWTVLRLEGITLAWGGGPEKCSSVISDENLIDILNMSEAVVKPATSMMLLLPEKIAKSKAFAEK